MLGSNVAVWEQR